METTNIFKETITHKEWLTKFKNDWTAKLLANTIDLEVAKRKKKANPKFAEQMSTGQVLTIDQIIRMKESNIEESLGYIEVAKTLLKAEEKGLVEEYWKDYKPFLQKLDIIKPDSDPLSLGGK